MNLQSLDARGYGFGTVCIRCNLMIWSCDNDILVDLDGCPLRSYYCASCAKLVTPEQAKTLADQARKLVHSNA